jgi:crooked neck
MPELSWKAYIDFEIEEGDREKARSLYERLVNLSGHLKVWISYAEFEASSIPIPRALREEENEDGETETKVVGGDLDLAKQVFCRGYRHLKDEVSSRSQNLTFALIYQSLMQCVFLLTVWEMLEQEHGTGDDVAKVQGMIRSKNEGTDEW